MAQHGQGVTSHGAGIYQTSGARLDDFANPRYRLVARDFGAGQVLVAAHARPHAATACVCVCVCVCERARAQPAAARLVRARKVSLPTPDPCSSGSWSS